LKIDFIFCTAGSFWRFFFHLGSSLAQLETSKPLSETNIVTFLTRMQSYGNHWLRDTAMVRKVNKTTTTFRRNAERIEGKKNVGVEMKKIAKTGMLEHNAILPQVLLCFCTVLLFRWR